MSITISRDNLIDAAYTAGVDEEAVRFDYSGRAMYGNTCVGVVVDSPGELLRFCAALIEESGCVMSDLESVREDNMGRSIIYYWPYIKCGDEGEEEE